MHRLSVFIFFMLLLAGCSSSKVLTTEKAEGADFSTYKTFDFYKVEARGDTNSQKFSENIEKLEDAIAIKLQKFGYLLSKTNPDLLINIGVVVREEVQTRQTDFRTDAPRYIGQRRYSWKSQDVEVGRYRQGTVTVDMVDRKQNKLVWQGAIEDIIPQKDSKLEKTIRKGVEKLFVSYPASK
jgi:hypothetical protein